MKSLLLIIATLISINVSAQYEKYYADPSMYNYLVSKEGSKEVEETILPFNEDIEERTQSMLG